MQETTKTGTEDQGNLELCYSALDRAITESQNFYVNQTTIKTNIADCCKYLKMIPEGLQKKAISHLIQQIIEKNAIKFFLEKDLLKEIATASTLKPYDLFSAYLPILKAKQTGVSLNFRLEFIIKFLAIQKKVDLYLAENGISPIDYFFQRFPLISPDEPFNPFNRREWMKRALENPNASETPRNINYKDLNAVEKVINQLQQTLVEFPKPIIDIVVAYLRQGSYVYFGSNTSAATYIKNIPESKSNYMRRAAQTALLPLANTTETQVTRQEYLRLKSIINSTKQGNSPILLMTDSEKQWLNEISEQLNLKDRGLLIKITAAMAEKLKTLVVLSEIFLALSIAIHINYPDDKYSPVVKKHVIAELLKLQEFVYAKLMQEDFSLEKCLHEISSFVIDTQAFERKSGSESLWSYLSKRVMQSALYSLLAMSYEEFISLGKGRKLKKAPLPQATAPTGSLIAATARQFPPQPPSISDLKFHDKKSENKPQDIRNLFEEVQSLAEDLQYKNFDLYQPLQQEYEKFKKFNLVLTTKDIPQLEALRKKLQVCLAESEVTTVKKTLS